RQCEVEPEQLHHCRGATKHLHVHGCRPTQPATRRTSRQACKSSQHERADAAAHGELQRHPQSRNERRQMGLQELDHVPPLHKLAAVTFPGSMSAVKPNGSTSLACVGVPIVVLKTALNASRSFSSLLRKPNAP